MKASAIFNTVLKSSLFHFLVLGGLIFAAFALVNDDTAPPEQSEIVLSVDEAKRLAGEFEVTWNRPPNKNEMAALMQN